MIDKKRWGGIFLLFAGALIYTVYSGKGWAVKTYVMEEWICASLAILCLGFTCWLWMQKEEPELPTEKEFKNMVKGEEGIEQKEEHSQFFPETTEYDDFTDTPEIIRSDVIREVIQFLKQEDSLTDREITTSTSNLKKQYEKKSKTKETIKDLNKKLKALFIKVNRELRILAEVLDKQDTIKREK